MVFKWIEGLFVEMPPEIGAVAKGNAVKALRAEIAALPKPKSNRSTLSARFMDTGGSDWTSGRNLPRSVFPSISASGKEELAKAAAEAQAQSGKAFSEMLTELVRRKCGGSAPVAYKRAGISRQAYSRIVSSVCSRVDKLTAMRLCIGLQLTWDEAVKFLSAAGYAFSDSLPIDKVFAYCVKNSIWNIFDVNGIVEACGLMPFDVA